MRHPQRTREDGSIRANPTNEEEDDDDDDHATTTNQQLSCTRKERPDGRVIAVDYSTSASLLSDGFTCLASLREGEEEEGEEQVCAPAKEEYRHYCK